MNTSYLGAVPIKGIKRTSFAPIPWAPPGQASLFNEKRMGQKRLTGAFKADALPTSIIVGFGGVAAISIGMKAPFPFGMLLISGGLAGLGYSVYNLFSGSDSDKYGVQEKGSFKASSPEDFEKVGAKFTKPKMYERLGSEQTVPGNLLVSNDSSSDVSFMLIIEKSILSGRSYLFEENIKETIVTVPANGASNIGFTVSSSSVFESGVKLVAKKLRSGSKEDEAIRMTEVTFYL